MARSGGTSKPLRSFDRICHNLLDHHRSTSMMLGFSSTIASNVQLSSSIVTRLMVANTLTHIQVAAQSFERVVASSLGHILVEAVHNFEQGHLKVNP